MPFKTPAIKQSLMRWTSLLLAIALAQVSTTAYSQITLKEKNAPLEKVLTDIEKQTKYVFLYDPSALKTPPITIAIKNATLEKTLSQLFNNLPIEFTVVDNNVLLKTKLTTTTLPINNIIVRGKVVDSAGQPLPGVTILDIRERKATQTDTSGIFSLKAATGDQLLISSIGYKEKEVMIGVQRYTADSALYIPLELSDSKLDQVQTIAYGKVSNRFNTGNVTTVKGSDLAMQPVSSLLEALQGLIPGLEITQQTGAPGSGFTVLLRGQSSLKSETDPLYVIDGLPYVMRYGGNLLSSSNANLATGSVLNMINPADIESIDVLKDADATAIYGSLAANGVVLITTKKGRPGPARFTIDVYSGLGAATRLPHYLDRSSYLAMRHEALRNDSTPVAASDYDINGVWDTTRYTDWSKVLMGNMVHTNDLQLQFTGGNNNIQYFAGAGFHNESTVFAGNGGDKKGSAHININGTTPNKKLTLQLTGSWLGGENTVQPINVVPFTSTAADAPPTYKSNDSLNWQNSTYTNPIAALTQQYSNHTHTLITSALLTFHVVKGLDLKVNVGYNELYDRVFNGIPATTDDPYYFSYEDPSYFRSATYYHNNSQSWIAEPQASFTHTLANGILTAMAGASYRHTKELIDSSYGSGFPSDASLSDISKARSAAPLGKEPDDYKYIAFFGRLNYNWKNEYIVSFNGRNDGSSRYGADRQFHFFKSAAAAWIFSAEPFFHRRLPWLSFGKLRASYGTTGNDAITGYLSQATFDSIYYAYQGSYGLQPSYPADPDISWESTRKMDVSLDLGFDKDRFLLNASYYRFRSSNLLLGSILSYVTGFPLVEQNLPVVIGNQGLEVSLQTINLKTAHFSWTTSAMLTIPRNKLTRFDNPLLHFAEGAHFIGYPLNTKLVLRSGGVDPQTGLYRFIDSSGNYTSQPNFARDFTAYVKLDPTLYGSVSNRLQYKSMTFELQFFFNRQVNTNPNLGTVASPPGFVNNNVLVHTADARWRYPGQKAAVQRYGTGYNALGTYYDAETSNLDYSNAAYIRCKNIYLAYQFPATLVKKFHMNNFTLYIKGQNLFTISPYKDYDPETGTNIAPVRLLAAGIKASF
jgi:TonB-dependent starch-binding outer membrane protein SusC